MIIWTPTLLSVLYACVLYFCICTCSAQLSMFHMERRSRNTLIITTTIIIIIIIIIIITIIILLLFQKTINSCQCFSTDLKTCVVAIDLESNRRFLI